MNTNLALATSQNFGSVKCDFLKDAERQEYFMTREQIGTALGYKNPNDAIKIIHNRNADRFDKFSTRFKLNHVEGNRTVSRETIVYSPKGVYEICRWSRQPKADAFMDWVWDVIDNLRTGEMTLAQGNVTFSQQAVETMIAEHLSVFKKEVKDEITALRESLFTNIDEKMTIIANSHLYLVKLAEQNARPIQDEPVPLPAAQTETQPIPVIDFVWKKEMLSKTKEAVKVDPERFESPKDVLREVYVKMRNVYGIVWEQVLKDYKEKYDLDEQVKKTDAISDNEQLKSIFEGILFDLAQPTPVAAAPESSGLNPVQEAILPLIQKRNDKSLNSNWTYQAVYKRMDISWSNRLTRYRKSHHMTANPKKTVLIQSDENLLKIFKDTIKKMMQE